MQRTTLSKERIPPSITPEQIRAFLYFDPSEIATGRALAMTVMDVPRDFVEQFLGNIRIIPADFLRQ